MAFKRSIKLQVSFAKEPHKRDNILQKRPIILSILLTVATLYDSLQHTATHCNTLQHTVAVCCTLHWSQVALCVCLFVNVYCVSESEKMCVIQKRWEKDTLQHTATSCNTLQHTATLFFITHTLSLSHTRTYIHAQTTHTCDGEKARERESLCVHTRIHMCLCVNVHVCERVKEWESEKKGKRKKEFVCTYTQTLTLI